MFDIVRHVMRGAVLAFVDSGSVKRTAYFDATELEIDDGVEYLYPEKVIEVTFKYVDPSLVNEFNIKEVVR